MSPSRTSSEFRRLRSAPSSHPSDPLELYKQNARTRAPSAARRSTKWLPMKPSAPVTITVLPVQKLVVMGSVRHALTQQIRIDRDRRKNLGDFWSSVSGAVRVFARRALA